MAVFAVHITSGTEEVVQLIETQYPKSDHYHISDSFYLVKSDSLAQTVANNIGLSGQRNATGVVFKLNAAYGGFDERSIWEWLSEAQKA